MADSTPYARLTGPWTFWVAPFTTTAEAAPNLDAAVAGNWVALGNTEGDQSVAFQGALEAMRDNDHLGPVKHVRPEAGLRVTATVVHLTLETMARTLGMAVADVVGGTSGALTTKKLGLKLDFVPTRYSLLARGGAIVASNTLSPYGAWPAQLYVPLGVFSGEATLTYSKAGSPGIEFNYMAEEDDNQSAGEQFGILLVQSA